MVFEFELSDNKEVKEFCLKEEFVCYVIEVWCMCFIDCDEELFLVWFEILLLEKCCRFNELFYWLKVNFLCLGIFVS